MQRRQLWLITIGLLIIALTTVAFYLHERFQEVVEESWVRHGAHVIYEQVFVWNGNTEIEYMIWNISQCCDEFIEISLMSHGVNVTDKNVELTIGEANLTVNTATREVVNGSGSIAYYVGDKWPFWIETNVTIGSTIDIWYGATAVIKNESIYVLGQQRNCWVIQYNWQSGIMKRWYDISSGILLKIHNVLYREDITMVVTETAVKTNIDL